MTKTLLVTNDFPPRPGGIQQFVHNLAVRQPAGSVVVYCSQWRGSADFDAAQPFPVIREDTSVLLPTPRVARRAAAIAREHGCDTAWFGAAAPLALLAGGLRRRAGITWAVAQTHGHEVGWAALPGGRAALKRIARGVDVVTYLSEYQRVRLAPLMQGRDHDAASGTRRRRREVRPRRRRHGGPGPVRSRRPAGRRVRLASRAAQGAGHVDPRVSRRRPPGARPRCC